MYRCGCVSLVRHVVPAPLVAAWPARSSHRWPPFPLHQLLSHQPSRIPAPLSRIPSPLRGIRSPLASSILCRRPSSRTINVTYPATSFIRLTPSCQEHPADELHHSGKIMPRHTTGNPRHETADIRRPVSSHRIVLHQSIEHGLCRKYHGILVCIVFSAEHCSCRK